MTAINPHLNFPGQTEEAFQFYRSVFGGEFLTVMRWKESPGGDQRPAEEQEKIMYIALPLGDGQFLMGADIPESMDHDLTPGNNFTIAIFPDSEKEGRRIFDGLAEGGQIAMPYEKAFWGDVFGQLTDKYGIQWMVNYTEREQYVS